MTVSKTAPRFKSSYHPLKPVYYCKQKKAVKPSIFASLYVRIIVAHEGSSEWAWFPHTDLRK